MSNHPTLKNPPIVEAMLDVQVIFPQGVELSALAGLHENFQQDYPQKNEERIVQFGFEHQAGEPPKALAKDQGVRGYRFISMDGKQIVQCRKDGFTFNRLSPYLSWNDVIKFAKPAWYLYQKTFPDIVITRVALRYINQVLLPIVKIEDYFTAPLPGPKMAELSYSGFLSQAIFRDQVTGFEANWIFAHQPTSDPTKMGVVLDIDVYASGATVHEEDVANLWERQRDVKNRVFFGSFTAKGLDLFQ